MIRRIASSAFSQRFAGVCAALACGFTFAPPSVMAVMVRDITLDRAYLAAGEVAHGKVILDGPAPAGAQLNVQLVGTAEAVAESAKTVPSGALRRPLLTVAAAQLPASGEVPFDISVPGLLLGALRVRADVVAADGATLALAQSAALEIGVRKHLDVAGDWTVAGIKLLEGEVPWRPKNWALPTPLPATVSLPGRLPFDQGFRGWITLKRTLTWQRDGDLQPRAVFLWGASDSALVKVNGELVGETAPHSETAFLTHWVEFHSPEGYKGEANELKRMLLLTPGTDQPVTMSLPKPLPPAGSAEIEMTLRATSGGIMGLSIPPFGVLRSLHVELAPAVAITGVTFDTQKPGPARRFIFTLTVANDSGKAFNGKIRTVYGRYDGEYAYTGACLPYADGSQDVSLPPGASTVDVVRDELPRFDTCRATFLLTARDGRTLDAARQDFHTVTIEIRDRRDLYLNNERFIVKGQGSYAHDLNARLQLKLKGGNAFRGHASAGSRLVPGMQSEAEYINGRLKDGLLTSAGSALLASCEKCIFWNPKDTTNIHKAVKTVMRKLAQCPGIVDWEATNELHGEPPEARVEIQKAFHAYDPYHRPVLCTKGSGEWEAEAHEGRVEGTDIVGCQYLLSKEGLDSVCAAITEQPIMSTEVNYNDSNLFNENRMYETWLEKGVCGSLLFDYSGNGLDQPVPLLAPADSNRQVPDYVIRASMRDLYQDLLASAAQQPDGKVRVTFANRMPYALKQVRFTVKGQGQFSVPDMKPGVAVDLVLPPEICPAPREQLAVQVQYMTHQGLAHIAVLAPVIQPAPPAAVK